jgi:hypothetical protein
MHFLSGGANEVTLASGQVVPIVGDGDMSTMMVVYGIGFIAVFFSYSLLYWHAGGKKEELRLSELEVVVTRNFLVNYILCMGVGMVSIALALFLTQDGGFFSGISYALLGPVLGIHGYVAGKKVNRMKEKLDLNQPQQDQQQRQQGPYRQRQQRPQGQQQRPQGQQQRPQGQQQRPQGQPRSPGQQHRRPQTPQQRPQRPEQNEPPKPPADSNERREE